jgi:hypothetical protein
MTPEASDDDLVPISVRLGEVVPPEDPEDWTRPLTWVAAFGMLAGPIVALAWFFTGPPDDAATAVPATYFAATLGSGLFGALVVVMLGVVMAGERQIGSASPTLAHAFGAAIGGVAGAVDAAIVAAAIARVSSRLVRLLPALASAILMAVIVVAVLMGLQSGA